MLKILLGDCASFYIFSGLCFAMGKKYRYLQIYTNTLSYYLYLFGARLIKNFSGVFVKNCG